MHLIAAISLVFAQISGTNLPGWAAAIGYAAEDAQIWYVGDAWLDSPGGELHFGLDFDVSKSGKPVAHLANGSERIELAKCDFSAKPGTFSIDIAHYDATLAGETKVEEQGVVLTGEWRKRKSADEWTKLPFHARLHKASEPQAFALSKDAAEPIAGRWAIQFSTDPTPAIGVFESGHTHRVAGTILTTTGDYRYLAGDFSDGKLTLSAFDGAHAFLFRAKLNTDDTLAGEFWAGDKHHETWTAKRDANAKLPDGFDTASINESVKLSDLVFPDVDGNRVSLADTRFAGKGRIIQIYGSWCPNCHDEAALLAELDGKYRERGLSVIGLAFEITGDAKHDAEQVRRYAALHKIQYQLLIAGTRDKEKAAAAFPLLNKIEGYPTTIFMDSNGHVRAVHTGYSGPATGEEHVQLRSKFEKLVKEILPTGADR